MKGAGTVDHVLPQGTVTLVFTDIERSTWLLHELGEAYGGLLAEHHRVLRAVWARHGGVEVDTEGDAFFVAFSDPAAAVAAVAEAQTKLAGHAWPSGHSVRVRMAIHTGTPRIQDGTYWGSDVHYAARLAAAAHGGQVLVSASTRPLVRDFAFESLGEHALKDFAAPRELFHLVIDGAGASTFPPPRTLERVRTNLPAPAGEFLGRERELADLAQRVSDGEKLVTIVGPGGSGKTRLALEFAHQVAQRFDGAWFVALAEVTNGAEVAGAVARVLGLPEIAGLSPLERLLDHLRTRSLLLILDNLEHLLEAAPLIGRIAAAGEGVRVVATSQGPLRVGGEHVLRLGPLGVPSGTERGLDSLSKVPAVALLLARSRAAGSSFALYPDNATDVARLCQQLEGMPLAIELAAARLNMLDPASLSARLERELDTLGKGRRDLPPRQRGLRAVLEWTTGSLDADERRVLAQLSVFAGGFTPDLAEATLGDVLDSLGTLLEVGLVRRGNDARLSLRPPVRTFAAELLEQSGDEQATYAALADALAELGERFERRWFVTAGEGRMTIAPEAANITAVLDWARDHAPLRHARLSAATAWWMTHSARAEWGRAHLSLALERVEDPTLRARCLQALGTLGLASVDPTVSVQAADAWRELGDVDGEVVSLLYAANLHGHRGEGAEAMALVDRAAASLKPAPKDEELWWLLDAVRADALYLLGRHAQAHALIGPLLARAQPGSWKQFWAATKSADIALDGGRPADALALYGLAIQALESANPPGGELMLEVMQADTIAAALKRLGRIEDAANVLAICELVHAELSWPPVGILGKALNEVREQLDDRQLGAAREHAASLGIGRGLGWIRDLALGAR